MALRLGSGGTSGGASGCSEDKGVQGVQNEKKNYHRHTPEQIQRLEAFYKECAHPDEKQRRLLGMELGMEPKQIKFWFQNKRTQTKAQNGRSDNDALRSENDRIRSENMALRESLKNVFCPTCKGPLVAEGERDEKIQKLQQGNIKLKLEYERVSNILAKYIGKPVIGPAFGFTNESLAGQGNRTPALAVDSLIGSIKAENLNLANQVKENEGVKKACLAEIAGNAMAELTKLLRVGQPLWIKSPTDDQYILDRNSYKETFPRSTGPKYPKSRMESSKDSGLVPMNAKQLVDLYLDPDKWAILFPTVVSNARTILVIDAGLLGNRSGSLQLMYEQMHILAPMIQPREFYVLRYCQQVGTGVWIIVDVSCDNFSGNSHVPRTFCWKHPSGWMIQEMPDGLSKVTCIEHVEVDDNSYLHPVYEDLVKSALGFGAKRWIMSLQRTCERHSYLIEASRPGRELGGGKTSVILLACQMVKSYCSIFSLFSPADFRQSSELTNDRVQVAVRKSTCPGRPVGIVIAAATAFWVRASPQTAFKYLSDHVMRSQWDVLCDGNPVREVMEIPTGSNLANRISVLQPVNPSKNLMIFQESRVEQLSSLIVYAPIDTSTMSELVTATDFPTVPILASGFAITTAGGDRRTNVPSSSTSIRGSGGSLLTVAFQILACNSLSTEDAGVDVIPKVDAFVTRAVRVIKSALNCSG